MTLLFQIIWVVIGTSLSVALTKIFIQNGRYIKENAELIKQNGETIREAIRQEAEATRVLVDKISALIVAEGDKTTRLIQELRGIKQSV